MNFAEPSYIYCLLPLLVVGGALYYLASRRQSDLKKVGSQSLIEQLTAQVNWRGRRWRNILWSVAILLLIVALMRPQWGVRSEFVERQGVEIMVALDISESMLAEDLRPNRLERAKLEISELMETLSGNDIGLVVFSGAAFVQFPLTSDFTTARAFLEGANPGIISRPGTAIAEAIQVSIEAFNEDRATQKVIVLLTDGEDHEGETLAAANAATEQNILIYSIGFGSQQGEPIPEYDAEGVFQGYKTDRNTGERVLTRLDESTLQDIALITGGRYFPARPDGREVGFIADEIANLQRSELETRFETTQVERFQLFVAAAIIALIVFEAIPDRKRVAVG